MKELDNLLSSFNLRCGLYLSADMSSQPMAVIRKSSVSHWILSTFVCVFRLGVDRPGRPMTINGKSIGKKKNLQNYLLDWD